ncbi:Dynein-1-beta heavy chain [Diplonema papillatum]|nr:Dynein-1-beta heavy chain [Diplonema papillatum]
MYPLRPLPPIEGSGREPVRRLKTVSHVLEFFEQTPRPPFKFVYCNKSTDSLRFRPYDLHVVLRGEQQSEHWVVTKQGIVHVVPFEAPELFRVDQWVKEATQFDKLTQLKLFKNYLSHKAFSRWKNNVRYGLFLQARTRCAKRLFLSKHTFAQPLFELHKLSFDLQTPALLAYPTQEVQITRAPGESLGLQFSSSMMLTGVSQGPAQRAPVERLLAQKDWRLTHINHQPIADHAAYQAFCSGPATLLFLRFAQKVHYDLKDFRDRQAEQRDVAEAQYAATTNAIRDQVAALCQRLIHAAHVPDFVTPEKLDEYLSAHSMVPGNKGMLYKSERDAEKQERKRALKKVMIECDFIGNFLRLVDSMVVESVFKAALSQSKAFLLHEQQPEKSKDLLVTFELTCQFDPQRFLMLVPTHANLQDAFKQLLAGVVKEAESVPRLPKTLGEQYKDKILHQPPDLISIESLLLADTRYQFIVQELEQVVTSSFERAQSASTDYKGCRNCKHFIDDEWKAEAKRWQLERDHLTAADFVRYIKRVKATFKADLEKMHDGDHGILHTSIKKLTSELIGPLELILDQIKTSLLDLATKRAQEITRQAYEREGTQSLETMKHRLEEKRITPLKYFAEWVRDCNGMYEKQPKVNQEVDAIEELFRVADQAGFNIPYVQLGTRNDMIDERDKYNQVVDTSKERRKKEMPAMLVQLKEALDDENKKLSAITKELTDPKSDYKNPKSPAQFILEVKLSALSQQLKAIKQWTGALNEWQVLFEQPVPPPCPALVQAEKYFDEKFDLWNSLARWEEKKRIWGTTPLDKLDIVDVKQQIEELFAKSYKMNKQDGDGVTEKLLSLVSAEKQHLPVMEALGNKALRDRHWERIFEAMNKASPPERTLDSMRAMGAFSHVAKVQEISSVATGEFGVQRDLDVVKNLWLDPADGLEFIIKNHREQADVFILGGLEEVIEKLEDNQVTIQTCLASRWAQGIRSDIEEWEEKLRITAETLDEWINLQKTWMYLEFIFSSEDIKKQLPEESRLFAKTDQDFCALMQRAHENPKIMPIAGEKETLNLLKRGNDVLDRVQKRLEDYLETKRVAFPRFYFLSNDELLEILSDVRNPLQVCKHLQKCFDNMKSLNFANPPENTQISAMVSSEGEIVPFTIPVNATGNVEHWLGEIERNMRKTLTDCMRSCVEACPQSVREEWYFQFPAQCVSCVDVIYWTAELEEVWDKMSNKGQPAALREYYAQYQQQILRTVELVKTDLNNLKRTLVCCLLVVDVHARSVLESLQEDNCTTCDDFNWQKQLRYYWTDNNVDGEPKNCWIGHSSAYVLYGYEYLGNQPRLVITPLTERAFLTCTGALAMNLGAAPQGPAGTGKTESVKDLGKALARQVVVFNCSDGLNYKMMSQMFAGLAQAGAWACFDEFNRIDIEVLSVVAQQMLEVTLAIGEGKDTMMFDGHKMKLNKNFGVFITMNPGYAGRTELPDNLKALFRPICMMIPDYALIAEIMFYAEGFADSKSLAQKMVQLYNLSSQQLSKQDHYDFGMRAVKSILVMAGSLKRSDPDAEEDMLLIRAMRDANVPKFLRDDTTLFMALIQDLFPTVKIKEVVNDSLIKAIEQVLVSDGKQVVHSFVEKLMQLYETMVVRHGVMLVGASMSGKTTNATTLRDALTKLKKETVDQKSIENNRFINKSTIHRLNPKSISMGEMYGDINPATREWSDGVLSHIARILVDPTKSPPPDRHWICFDGPVDAIWIENMNTVLDDNKLLCLVNGERIKIPDTISIMFEVQDLRVASPATVSRCGMVYMEPFYLDGGWLPLARSFSETIVKTANFGPRWMHGRLMDLLQQVVPDTLTFLRKDCSEYIATIDSQLVMSLCKLMQAYVANWDEQDDGDDAEAEAESAGGEKVDIGLSRPAKPEKKPVNEKSLFDKFFIMSYIWSLGGNVADASRQKFDAFMQQVITKTFPEAKFPTTGSCFNYIVHKAGNVFLPWAYKVPTFRYHRDKEFFEMLVQTPDTAILRQHITYLFSVNRHVLVNGVTGVGKSAAVSYVLTDVMQSENPSAPWQSCGMSFSAQTSSVNLQEFVEVNLTKKKNSLLGAAPGKRCIILVDDANMPEPEKYGASPPLELLRQLLQRGGSPLGDSEGGLFDRKRKDLYKDIRDVVCIACCGPPGGGKHEMTQRLTTHFHCLVVPQLSADSMISIFTSILAGFLSSFSDEVSKLAKQVVSGTIEVFQRISVEMLPTPLKIHYTFNLRDLSKVVQGILMMEPKHLSTSDQLAKVFCHEASRVFHDRLICEEDREWWWTTIGEVCKKYLNAKVDNSWRKLLFGGWADPKDDSYKEISANPGLQDLLNDYQVDFSVQKSKESDLVMFDDAIQHLTRMCRMLRQPRGNALLVGVGGSGRHSITELAAFICQQRCFQIAVSRGYDIPQFRDDLKNLLLEAGCKAKPVVFLFSDTQIVREQFLEDINNVLNVGDVPNIYLTEDYEKIINATRERCTSDNRRSIIRRYVQLVRDNLHVIFCVSPIGDNFRARLRMFPSLVNCMTIDWYTKWPAEALKQVAHRVFGKASGVSAETVKENLVKLAEMCVTMHVAIEEQSENMWNTLKRRNYTTPTSYLSLLASYLNMLEESMSDTDSKLGRFQSGLDKLASTSSMVEKLKKELQDMQPQLEKASQEAEVQGKEIAKGKDEASKVKAVVEVEEARCKKIMTEAEEIRSDCQAGLDKAMPVFFQAQEALKTLEKKDIDQIKSYAKPPEPVEKTMNAVILLLGASKLDWSTAKQFMADTRFFKKLEDFDKDNIDAKVVKKLQVFIKDAGFTPEIIGQSSNPCKSMCMWCRAIDNYYWVTKDLGPKKEALKGAEAKLQAAKAELDEKQQELNVCNNKVAKLEKDAEETIRRKDNLEHQKQQAVAKLERADQLLGGLAGEAGRWKESVASLEESKGMLVGTMLLASGCVAYVGPFPSKYRKDIVTQWTQKCQSLKIPVKEGFTLDTITDQVTTRAWSQYGLPLDPFSVENGTILSRSQRWCLMIDPQGQANNFIKKKEKENQLKVLKLTQDKFMQQLEQNIRIGRPVLIENIGEELDAALDPVLLKQTFKTGGRVVIKLGDTEVDYDENFKLFLTTKLPNPLYSPELQIKVAIVNFTVTTKGLEDQLLNDVVQVERADLAENKDKVVVQIADGQRTLKNIQDRILKMLAEATGDILDNVELIQTLADSKVTSSEVTNALADAEVMSAEISLAAEKYRPVATRGSLLYATIADIANIDHMYQYSLTFYKSLFVATIQKTAAPQETGVDARVKDLVPVITQATYNAICRGLFEKDKIIFSFTMAYHIFKDAGAITEDEWSLFLRGSAGGQKIPPKPSHVEWTTSWEACCALSTLPGLEFLPEEVANTPGWAEWMKDPNPHEAEYPGTASGISEWRKLLILKALRSEKCLFGIPKLVRHMMGPSYTESPPFRLAEAFDDSNSVTPLIFVLSTGTDPTVIFTSFAKSQGHDPTKLQMLSLGQDQGPKAQAMIERGRNEGEWVYLQNCHVYTSWMPTLERIMEDLAQKASAGQVHPNFRLWLTSNPSTAFPVSVLQMGLKLTREPPKGLRANLKDSFNAINDELWAEQDEKKQLEWKKLIFSLVFFHGLVQERRKFGALGWNIAYEWSGPDLTASVKTIRLCLSDFDDIPWPAVRYTIGVINYGGRVTDFLDNRLLQTFIGKYFVETTFGDDFAYDDKGEYRPPPGDASREGVMDMLENLPLYEDPTLYGLPTNASITFQAKESSAMMDTIINVQPKAGGGGGSGTTDSVVWSIAEDFIARCPALVDKSKAHADVFRITEAGTMISLGTVLSQEIDQFNSLLKALMSSMKELKRAIKGEVVLSASLEQMYNSFVFGRVPPNWEKKAYLCLKPLQPWYTDMIERIEFLTDWCYNGMPTLYWLPGMFFPQGFLTGILQTHSREHTIPIDELKHGVSVRGETDRRQPADRPKDGCLIIGFYLEGARWDLEKNQLAESVPGQLFSELPSLWLLPHKKTDPDPPNTYQCPLYKALTRSGTLSTTGLSTNYIMNFDLPLAPDSTKEHWILRGTASFCMLNT